MLVSSDLNRDVDNETQGRGPRRDYVELAQQFDADIFDVGSVQRSRWGRILGRVVGRGPAHALLAATKMGRYQVVFSDSEHVGLFVGLLRRLLPSSGRHVVLAHHLTPSKKHLFVRLGRPGIDAFILHSEAQREFAEDSLSVPPDMIRVLPYQVDTDFWRPLDLTEEDSISTAGLECRDYETLLEAIEGLPLKLHIGAASNWSRKQNTLRDRPLTEQVTVTSYSYVELREVYARSRFVVVPLLDVDFQAGITTILEAMAVGKAVVTTRTKGHCGAVVGPIWRAGETAWPAEFSLDLATGIYVEPSDSAGLHSAMRFLMENPAVARNLGENGRSRALSEFTLTQFVERFGSVILGPDHVDRGLTRSVQ